MKNLLTGKEITRREIIGGLGGILAAGSAPHITSAATRGLGLRNAMLSGKKLPYLRRVAYLESSDTQWIDANVQVIWNAIKCEFGVKFISTGDNGLIGYRTGYLNGPYLIFGGTAYTGIKLRLDWSKSESYSDLLAYNDFHDIVCHGDNVIADGKVYQSGKTIPATKFSGPFRIFSVGGATPYSRGCSVRHSYVRIYEDGYNLTRSFVPVLDNDGVPCLYDEVSGQLFYNQGTGEFTWGELDAASNAPSQLGGGYKRKCVRRSYRRSSRPSARFYAALPRWEVAA